MPIPMFPAGAHPVVALPWVTLDRLTTHADADGREVLGLAQALANRAEATAVAGTHLATALVGLGWADRMQRDGILDEEAFASTRSRCRDEIDGLTAAPPQSCLARPMSYMWSLFFAWGVPAQRSIICPAVLYLGLDLAGTSMIAGCRTEYLQRRLDLREACNAERNEVSRLLGRARPDALTPEGWGIVPQVPGVDGDSDDLVAWLADWPNHELRAGHRIPLAVLLAMSGIETEEPPVQIDPITCEVDCGPVRRTDQADGALSNYFCVPWTVRRWEARLAQLAQGRPPRGRLPEALGMDNLMALQRYDAAIGAQDARICDRPT